MKDTNLVLRNNTGNKTKSSLIEGFVVRTKIFSNVFLDIQQAVANVPGSNYLFIGQRGAGKTTLLYRLKYAIDDNPDLAKDTITVMFSEEQYNLLELINLWECTAEYLEDCPGFERLADEIEDIDVDGSQREELAYEVLENKLIKKGKRIIVFIENIDVFFKKIGLSGQERLLKVLETSTVISMICSATTHFDGIDSFSDPFKIIQLHGLTRSESVKLLYALAKQKGEVDHIQHVIREHPKRLESLRRLTGGNPRIISYLFQIFLDNENGRAIIDLYQLLDDITFLYKAELDQQSPQQQKVIDVIARNWDAIPTKDIAQRTGIESKHVSAILKALEKNQVVERVATKTKNHLYRLKDRFLNIWYLMRFGKKKDKQSVIWLVRFYDIWCDRSELSRKIESHINSLQSEEFDATAALDLGNAFLSCKNVAPDVRIRLYKATKKILPDEFVNQLASPIQEAIQEFVRINDFEKAIEALNEIQLKNKEYYQIASWVYFKKGDYETTIDLLEQFYLTDPTGENAFAIGSTVYSALFNAEGAVRFFEKALDDHGIKEAAVELGRIYLNDLDDLTKAKRYLIDALQYGIEDKGELYALLGDLYMELEDPVEAENYLLKGVELNNAIAAHRLGHFYDDNDDWDKTVEYFLKSLAWGKTSSLMCLFVSSFDKERADKKEFLLKIFEENIDKVKKNPARMVGYARLLLWNNLVEKSASILSEIDVDLLEMFDNDDEASQVRAVNELIRLFTLLIAKGEYHVADDIFRDSKMDYKQLLRPVYYTLMYYMQNEYPNEYLKAGQELTETIEEVQEVIKYYRSSPAFMN